MNSEEIHRHVKCCMCEGTLPVNPTMVQLPVTITWAFPQWGNSIKCAHDDRKDLKDVRYAVEFMNDNGVKYHRLRWNGEDCELLD